MRFFTVRDLRSATKTVWDTLEKKREVIITNNGKPTALMIPVTDTNLEDVLATVRQAGGDARGQPYAGSGGRVRRLAL